MGIEQTFFDRPVPDLNWTACLHLCYRNLLQRLSMPVLCTPYIELVKEGCSSFCLIVLDFAFASLVVVQRLRRCTELGQCPALFSKHSRHSVPQATGSRVELVKKNYKFIQSQMRSHIVVHMISGDAFLTQCSHAFVYASQSFFHKCLALQIISSKVCQLFRIF